MNINERIKMYQAKEQFISAVSKAFENCANSNVQKVSYEVYVRQVDNETTYYTEFIVVTFVGGGKSVRVASGNSDNANFREIGKLIDGGYYDELDYYERIKANSTELKLEEV